MYVCVGDLKTSKKRPMPVFKGNLLYDDFVGIPNIGQRRQLHTDEITIEPTDFI